MSLTATQQKFRDKISSATDEQKERLKTMFPEEYAEWENSQPTHRYLNEFVCAPENKDMLRLKSHVKILAEVDDPVLIIGPTGTGKELLAQALHGNRPGKFIDINCAGLPENLIESELFGHVKGSFTGAVCDKTGLLQSAYNGTIFLDEIGELPLVVQAKLLRAIQEKKARKVGADIERGEDNYKITCRFVAATHKNIKSEMIPAGQFREDLYWRLAVFTLHIPGLDQRTIDIPHIIKRIVAKDHDKIHHDIEDFEGFCEVLIRNKDKLTGNVRQLQKLVRNWHVLGMLPKFD